MSPYGTDLRDRHVIGSLCHPGHSRVIALAVVVAAIGLLAAVGCGSSPSPDAQFVESVCATALPQAKQLHAIYWEVVPNARIVFTYELLIDEVRSSVSLVTVELERDGEGTRLTLIEHGAFFDGLEDPDVRPDGWGSILDALAGELERGR